MKNYCRFFTIYETTLVTQPFPKVVGPEVTIDFVVGPKEYKTVRIKNRILMRGVPPTLEYPSVKIPSGVRCIVVTSRIPFQEIRGDGQVLPADRYRGYRLIDETVAIMSAVLSPDIFDREMFRGPLVQDQGNSSFIARSDCKEDCPPIRFLDVQVAEKISSVAKNFDVQDRKRLQLMGKHLSRAAQAETEEEKCLSLWIVLEVHPMREMQNERRIIEMVERITGAPWQKVKDGLSIDALKRVRNDIVHHGGMNVGDDVLGDRMGKLEVLANTAIRDLLGLSHLRNLYDYLGMSPPIANL